MSTRCLLAASGLFTLVLVGCNGGGTVVTGAVTYNGQPVELGSIAFEPVDGAGQLVGAQIIDGRYTVDNAAPGKKRAVIQGKKKINHGMSTDEAMKRSAEAKAASKDWAGQVAEPADYIAADAEGNSQEIEITSGEQTIDFAITGPPRP